VQNYDQVFQHPQVLARQLLVANQHPLAGTVRMVGKPLKFSDTPADDLVPSPSLGQHSQEILWRLGYTSSEIEQLQRDRVV
jgi:crotonobetainyl-CoA:carnitine CoA-transferase CaiB-like acyl-CoA transferase